MVSRPCFSSLTVLVLRRGEKYPQTRGIRRCAIRKIGVKEWNPDFYFYKLGLIFGWFYSKIYCLISPVCNRPIMMLQLIYFGISSHPILVASPRLSNTATKKSFTITAVRHLVLTCSYIIFFVFWPVENAVVTPKKSRPGIYI